jgi:hypothetical protein
VGAKCYRRAPTEAWLFAQAVFGKPIPKIVRPEVLARAKRAELEEWAQFSSRHAAELRRLRFAEAKARHDRELLEFAAQISTKSADELRALQRKEAAEREAWRRAEKFVEMLLEGRSETRQSQRRLEQRDKPYLPEIVEWNADQPRQPKGTSDGGQWAPMGGGAAGGIDAADGTPATIASYSAQTDKSLPSLGKQSSRNHVPHGDTATPLQPGSASPASYQTAGEPDILNPASQNSVSRTFWEAIRRGDWTAAEDIIRDVANAIDKTKLQTIKTALKRIRGLNSWRNQASSWTRKRITKEIATLEETLARHLAKRDGVDTAETARIRYQLMFLKGLLK